MSDGSNPDKSRRERSANSLARGIAIGIVLGAGIGFAMHIIAIGIGIGVALGVALADGELRSGSEPCLSQGHLKHLTQFDDDSSNSEDWNDGLEEQERLRARKIRSWLLSKASGVGPYLRGEMWASDDAGSGLVLVECG